MTCHWVFLSNYVFITVFHLLEFVVLTYFLLISKFFASAKITAHTVVILSYGLKYFLTFQKQQYSARRVTLHFIPEFCLQKLLFVQNLYFSKVLNQQVAHSFTCSLYWRPWISILISLIPLCMFRCLLSRVVHLDLQLVTNLA